MPVPTDITAGTISISGSTVTGVGTSFVASDIRQGDLFIWIEGGAGQWSPIVQTVTSNTVLTLAEPWTGPTISGARYRLRYQWDSSRVSAQSRQLIEMLDNGNILALSSLTGPGVPVFDGPHSMTVRPETDFINGVAYNVQVDTLPDRAAYDGQAAGFSVLVSDVGDGRSAVYSKASNTTGDWTDPAYVTGPVGPLPVFEAGSTTRGPLASDINPITGGYQLNLTIPTQITRGNYSGVTAYLTGDIVQSAGSSWVALQSTTGNAPPSLPTTSNSYWQLLARAGNDGAGTVTTLVGGDGIDVDSTDPTTPVISVVPFVPDDGTNPGVVGGVPAPAAGDAAAGKALLADGTWGSAGADSATIQSYWMPTNLEMSEISPVPLLIGMGDGNGVFDGFNSLSWVDVAGAIGLDASEAGLLKPSEIISSTFSTTFSANSPGYTNFNLRFRIDASLLSSSGPLVRLSLIGATSGSPLLVTGMYLGHRASSGDVYDFDGTQVPVTVGGVGSFSIPINQTVVTDWIAYSLDETKDLIVSLFSSSGDIRAGLGSASLLDFWAKTGANEASTSNVSGYTQSGSYDFAILGLVQVSTGVNDLSVDSQNINTPESPTWGRLVSIVTENDAGVNSDLVFSVSRNGSDFLTITMSQTFVRADGSVFLDSGVVDLSAITSGTSARWKIETNNSKRPTIGAVGVLFGVET